MTNAELKELSHRDTLRYCISHLEQIHKSQRDLNKLKALEFVIDKLNAGIKRSTDRSRALQAEV